MENGVVQLKENPSDNNILEQIFSQLPEEGKNHLRNYLQNLASLQNIMVGVIEKCHGQQDSK